MSIFNVLSMIGGLALFLFGMHVMGESLTKASGGRLEKILEKLTSNKLLAVVLGAGVTAIIQSSSATTVMVVGFVNSGIMKLSQAVGVIMGANVGTTITAWLLSLVGLEGDSLIVQLFKPESFTPILALFGVILLMFSKKEKNHDIGSILLGFAVLMFGMSTMSEAVEPLADVPEFTAILTTFTNPVLGVLAGTALTAIIQSSSASVGILQALSVTGVIDYRMALPIIMGQNIGTCITAMISSIGTTKNARRAALIHLYFNIIGSTVFLVLFYTANAFMKFAFLDEPANALGIAVIHSIYNIFATCILLPFSDGLVKLSCLTIRDSAEEAKLNAAESDFQVLDARFLDTPPIATAQCKNVAVKMAEICKKALFQAMDLLKKYDEDKLQEVCRMESLVDRYEDELGNYLVKLSSRSLTEKDSLTISMLLHCIGDFERISDHAVNIAQSAKEMYEKELKFSKKAEEEIIIFSALIQEIVSTSVQVFETEDVKLAKEVEPMEEVVDGLNDEIKKRHIRRLRKGKCTIELGFSLSDITTNYERIADHCSNIAISLIQIPDDAYASHEYVENLEKGEDSQYHEALVKYTEKYMLP
ncbi:na/Pi-cotransporter [Clostridium sp. CAG:632]|nr:Na/Pi cotransporter family protein [Clostridium sp.]CCY59611.1 na/Pi-cotransporter [Clostridium sp. CAG:632]